MGAPIKDELGLLEGSCCMSFGDGRHGRAARFTRLVQLPPGGSPSLKSRVTPAPGPKRDAPIKFTVPKPSLPS